MGIVLIIVESYNFRSYGIDNSINKAQAISEVVKNGLTAHMVNGNMDQREVFLSSIASMKNIENLWIIRSKYVTEQYGKPLAKELPRDDMDKSVLNKGNMQYRLDEKISKTTIRVTIPYKAEIENTINCLECHNVKQGDTLGAISIVMDISDIKNSGINLILLVLAFTIIAIILIMYFANQILKPHLDMLEELSGKIKNISNGIFTNIITRNNLSDESKHLIKEYNLLVNGLSNTFTDIDQKLNVFIGNESHESNNPLLNSQKVIKNLSEIYQFKKEIELDGTKEEIYGRLSQILINRFRLKRFNFLEHNKTTKTIKLVYEKGNDFFCSHQIFDNAPLCRISRSGTDVCSVEGHDSCQYFHNHEKLHYCISLDIGEESKLIVNFILANQNELRDLKKNISLIKNYLVEASPSLTVKSLLEELKASAFKDGLTGLYNRKFLDEYLTKLIPQARREEINIGVLMLDMDHFKAVNDEYGHDAGDIVLKELAQILAENVRESDIVVRYGGEEFIILLIDVINDEAALKVANKIKDRVKENEINIYAGNKLRKTISIGCSIYPKDSTNFDVVMKNADIALYDAKENGRDQVVRFKEKIEVELF
jgi:diguanylate cyclase (GGDEF)-like protein